MAKENPKCASTMESEKGACKRRYCFRTFTNVLSFAFSAVSIAFCIFLSIQTAEIKSRVLDLETGDGERLFSRPPGFSMDEFNSLIQQRVDELLSQVSVTCLILEMRVTLDRLDVIKFHMSTLLTNRYPKKGKITVPK